MSLTSFLHAGVFLLSLLCAHCACATPVSPQDQPYSLDQLLQGEALFQFHHEFCFAKGETRDFAQLLSRRAVQTMVMKYREPAEVVESKITEFKGVIAAYVKANPEPSLCKQPQSDCMLIAIEEREKSIAALLGPPELQRPMSWPDSSRDCQASWKSQPSDKPVLSSPKAPADKDDPPP